ncbi:phenazine biosynthesis-like protein [Glonium stellatum]|uniref:Phenazine biosynthesis-like protein n=1 Tax=Glonium stellatum TaxID=574774 RepID=A0A8E2JVX6_9PEZI|nr:phenazine biosynthesis-like protein [Glonium stellatum]
MKLSFATLDVFTSARYSGNPVAIVTVPSQHRASLTQAQKQAIATEFNISETVFIHEQDHGADVIPIDIFTAIAEVPFAGHPIIGTTFFLLNYLQDKHVKSLITKAGPIPILLSDNDKVIAKVPQDIHIHAPRLITTISPDIQETSYPVVSIVKGMTFILASLPDLGSLEKYGTHNLKPGYPYDPATGGLMDAGPWCVGFTGTYWYVELPQDGAGRRVFRTRMHGSREDPATGSAASALTGWLALQEKKALGKGPFEFVITQGVEMGRRSVIGACVTRNEDGDRIEEIQLNGTAVKVMEGFVEI